MLNTGMGLHLSFITREGATVQDKTKTWIALFVAFGSGLWSIPAFSADVACRFKADTEPVDVEILIGGKDHWHNKIQKGETKTVTVPEGSFTIISRVFNPNLKTKEDIRTETHTRMCGQQVALSVPLFAQER